jgi:hypothetical protein
MLPLDRSNTAGPCIYISSLRAYYVRTRVQISRAVLTTEIDRWWLFQLPYRSMCWDADRSVRWIKSGSDRSVTCVVFVGGCVWSWSPHRTAPHPTRAVLPSFFLLAAQSPPSPPPPAADLRRSHASQARKPYYLSPRYKPAHALPPPLFDPGPHPQHSTPPHRDY